MDNIINIDFLSLNQLPIVNKNGSFSNIYKYKDGQCLKIWKENIFGERKDIGKFIKFSNLKLTCAVIPKKIVMVDGKFKGYTMNYIKGISIEECDRFDFSFFINKYYDLISRQERELGYEGIIVDDIHSFNILWDNTYKRFISVDIDNWRFLNLREDIINNCNFKDMREFFADFMFDNGSFYYYHARNMEDKDSFISFYEGIRKDLQMESDVELKTVRDVKKVLRRM